MKKLDVLLGEGVEGICESVSIVRSDSDGRCSPARGCSRR
jgi:hypothetical protein